MSVVFVNFATADFIPAQSAISSDALAAGAVDRVLQFSDLQLRETEEWRALPLVVREGKGFGCFWWKPYVIRKALESTSEGDLVFYSDCGRYGVPHGLACAFTMPSVLRFNAVADDGRLARFACSMGYADCAAMADALGALLQSCGISELLRGFSLSAKELSSLAHEMITPGRADNNLRAVGAAEVLEILSEASLLLSHQM